MILLTISGNFYELDVKLEFKESDGATADGVELSESH